MLGGMDACSGGTITVDGTRVSGFNARQLTTYRRHDIGFVFQFYNLVGNLTALENVELAAQICKDPLDAATVLDEVGLAKRANNFPGQLSGRRAAARGLPARCEEPQAPFVRRTHRRFGLRDGKAILKLLQDTCRDTGRTVVVVTHNSAFTAIADRVIHVREGSVAAVN